MEGILFTALMKMILVLQTEQLPIKDQVINEIVVQSQIYGVNTDTALRIAKCESGYDPFAKNPYSSAKGVYQFVHGTWDWVCSGEVLNYKDNVRCFMEQYHKHKNWWVCK